MPPKRRFLLTTLDAAGNWPPEIVLVRALVERGHEVRVLSDVGHAAQVGAAGAEFRPYEGPMFESSVQDGETPEAEMRRVVRDVFFNRRFATALLAEVERDPPDVLLVDQMLLMAAAAAERTMLPTAMLWHTVFGPTTATPTLMPASGVAELNAFRGELGLPPVADRRGTVARTAAILACTYEAFDRVPKDRPPQLHYVGPLACVPRPLPPYASPWKPDDRRPLVLVSYSTSFQNQVPALQRVADAVATLPTRVLLTLGQAVEPAALRLPSNVTAERYVPHAAVLPEARLVVTHAGHGTVMAAVTAGVPLVCMPMGRDQHAVAACVEQRGLGIVVPESASIEELRRALATAIADEALQARARTFAAGLDVAAGLRQAIHILENLA